MVNITTLCYKDLYRIFFFFQLENGSFTRHVPVDELQIDWKRLPRNTRLYVQMNITDAVNNAVDTYEDSSTFISNPTYTVEFKGSKTHFRPGFNYTLWVSCYTIFPLLLQDVELVMFFFYSRV